MNHRYALRVSTNIALFIFLCFTAGVLIFCADQFLDWDLLPNWIDASAEFIIAAFGITAGLAMATSALCGFALIAESAAARADIQNFNITRKTWKWGTAVFTAAVVVLVGLNQWDNFRKSRANKVNRIAENSKFLTTTQQLNASIPGILNLMTPELLELTKIAAESDDNTQLATFLSAVRSSTATQPQVALLVRAAAPYQYCRLALIVDRPHNQDEDANRYRVEKQFYIGFPSQAETDIIESLFSDNQVTLSEPIAGAIIDNRLPSSWGTLRADDQPVGLIILRSNDSGRDDFFHPGPAVPSGQSVNNQ